MALQRVCYTRLHGNAGISVADLAYRGDDQDGRSRSRHPSVSVTSSDHRQRSIVQREHCHTMRPPLIVSIEQYSGPLSGFPSCPLLQSGAQGSDEGNGRDSGGRASGQYPRRRRRATISASITCAVPGGRQSKELKWSNPITAPISSEATGISCRASSTSSWSECPSKDTGCRAVGGDLESVGGDFGRRTNRWRGDRRV